MISFELTSGNIADNNQELLKRLFDKLYGVFVGDKGYLSKLFVFFYENGLLNIQDIVNQLMLQCIFFHL